jgi:hypothetical protein
MIQSIVLLAGKSCPRPVVQDNPEISTSIADFRTMHSLKVGD